MAGAKNKAKDRQSSRHKAQYMAQKDKTPINKIIKMARHIANNNDQKTMSKLRQMPAIDRKRAFQKTDSARYRAVIENSY